MAHLLSCSSVLLLCANLLDRGHGHTCGLHAVVARLAPRTPGASHAAASRAAFFPRRPRPRLGRDVKDG
jgi:hypothetical protein